MTQGAATKRLASINLNLFKLPGDVQLSPDGKLAAWTQNALHLSTNDYDTVIWLAATNGETAPRQVTRGTGASGRPNDRSPRFAPDGAVLAFVADRGGTSEIWALDLVNGGEAAQLSHMGGAVSSFAWSPDGRWLAVSARPAKAPPPKLDDWRVTGWQPGQNQDVTIITKLQYKYNGRGLLDDRHAKIHLVEVASGRSCQVTFGAYDDSAPVWSPDGRWVGFVSSRRPDREIKPRSDIWAVDVSGITSAGLQDLPKTPDELDLPALRLSSGHPGSLGSISWSPDGHWLLATGIPEEMGGAHNTHPWLMPFEAALRSGRANAADFMPATSEWIDILEGFDRSLGNSVGQDVRADGGSGVPLWSHDGRWIIFTATDGGFCRMYRVKLPAGMPLDEYVPHIEALTGDDPAVAGSFASARPDQSTELLAMIAGGPANPGEIFTATLTDRQKPTNPAPTLAQPLTPLGCPVVVNPLGWRQISDLHGWLGDYSLSRPERVLFPSIENNLIEGWLMKPLDFDPDERYPAILEIHGGPHSTYGLAFNHEFQMLCARGFGVFFTNPHGSKGYGYGFAARVVGDWAGIDAHDLMAAADCLAKVRWVDERRLGVTGGSQGGYLTNWLIGHTTRFAAAVTQRSMSNLYSKYGVADNGWTHDRHGMGGADLWDNEALLMERSPIRYAPYVRTPTLIIHSDQDLRCPLEQGEQWYVALKRLGVETELVRFTGENHELSRSGKPRNRVERLERLAGWFERHMLRRVPQQ